MLRAVPDRYGNAHVIDWHGFSATHDDYFTADGFHLSPAGQLEFSSLIAGEIGPLPLDAGHEAPKVNERPRRVDVIDRAAARARAADGRGRRRVGRRRRRPRRRRRSSTSNGATRRPGRSSPPSTCPRRPCSASRATATRSGSRAAATAACRTRPCRSVDVKTGKVVFTKTLTGTPCSCPIVAGSAGVWVVGNSSDYALHLSSSDGHVIANVPLGTRALSHAAIEIRGRLVVGLDDGTIDVVDPATNRIEQSIPLPTIGDPPAEAVVAMSNAAGAGRRAPIRRSTPSPSRAGRGRRVPDRSVAGESVRERDGLRAGDGRGVRELARVVLGSDRLLVSTTHAVVSAEFVYDAPNRRSSTRVTGYGVHDRAGIRRGGLGRRHGLGRVPPGLDGDAVDRGRARARLGAVAGVRRAARDRMVRSSRRPRGRRGACAARRGVRPRPRDALRGARRTRAASRR